MGHGNGSEPKVSLFRAKEYIDALAVPAIEDRHGKIHTGRLLSFQEVLPLQKYIDALQDEDATPEKTKELVTQICQAIAIPPEVVLELPPKIMLKAVLHFFESMFGVESGNDSSPNRLPTNTSV